MRLGKLGAEMPIYTEGLNALLEVARGFKVA